MTRSVSALLLGTLLLGGCADGGGNDRAATTSVEATGPADDQRATVVSNDRLRFDPGIVEAGVGTLVLTHRNGGGVPHNLVFADRSLGEIATVTGGQQRSITLKLSEPGTYAFVCTFHDGQTGKVVVS